jgi:hypothetical protein
LGILILSAGPSKYPKHHEDQPTKEHLPHHSLPKIHFPKFDGSNPKIWFDNCVNYFTIYSILEELKVTTVTMHLEGNAPNGSRPTSKITQCLAGRISVK